MSPNLIVYLSLSYRRDVLGQSVDPRAAWSEGLREEAMQELQRLNRLGADDLLAKRDFAACQHRKALKRALEQTHAA